MKEKHYWILLFGFILNTISLLILLLETVKLWAYTDLLSEKIDAIYQVLTIVRN
jgi:hypothetical protein